MRPVAPAMAIFAEREVHARVFELGEVNASEVMAARRAVMARRLMMLMVSKAGVGAAAVILW